MTAVINQAFSTLKAPLSRAIYLLKLEGINALAETDMTMDNTFLMRQMEFREALEAQLDHQDTQTSLQSLNADVHLLIEQLQQEFANYYQDNNWTAAEVSVRKMQFMVKLADEITQHTEPLVNLSLIHI